MRQIEPLAHLISTVRCVFSTRSRHDASIRVELGYAVSGDSNAFVRSARITRALESLIDQRIYFGRALEPSESLPDLDAIVDALMIRIAELRAYAPDRPIFISPFHYVSQYANIYIVDKLAERLGLDALAVVSGVPRNTYGDDHALVRRLNILYTYGDANRGGLGVRLSRSLRQNHIAALFADVPPFTMHRYPMETAQVTRFGRDARIHRGVFRIGARSNAWLVPFYLRFSRGRFGMHIFDSIALAEENAPQMLAGCIESALRDNYHSWLPAGHPAMYSFAPSR